MAKLAIYRGETLDREIDLEPRTFKLGRGDQNDIVLPDAAKSVSRFHAELRFEDGRYTIVDLNSQNGTWVAGRRVAQTLLEPGTTVVVGTYRLVFLADPIPLMPDEAIPPSLEVEKTMISSPGPVPSGPAQISTVPFVSAPTPIPHAVPPKVEATGVGVSKEEPGPPLPAPPKSAPAPVAAPPPPLGPAPSRPVPVAPPLPRATPVPPPPAVPAAAVQAAKPQPAGKPPAPAKPAGAKPGGRGKTIALVAGFVVLVLAAAGAGIFFWWGRISPQSQAGTTPPVTSADSSAAATAPPPATTPPEPQPPAQPPAVEPSAATPAPAAVETARPEEPVRGVKAEPVAPVGGSVARPPTPARERRNAAARKTPAEPTAKTPNLSQALEQARSAMNKGDYLGAIAGFEAILKVDPKYPDAAQLLATARDGAKNAAQAAVDAGTKAEASGDYEGARKQFERAQQLDPESAAPVEAMRRLKARMQGEGEDAFKRAKQFDALGRTSDAVAMYEKAVKLLPADHANAKTARERLAALRGGE